MKIYLVRHGETDWNKEGRLQGSQDIPMNENGIIQMNALGEKLSGEGLHVDRIITSPLQRARTTARIMAEKMGFQGEIETEELLKERSFGLAEGMVWKDDIDLFDEKYEAETIEALCERAGRAVVKCLKETHKDVMIVSHGAILMAVVVALSGGTIAYEDPRIVFKQGTVIWGEVDEDGLVKQFHTI